MIVLGFEYNYGDSVYVVQIIYWHEGKMILGVEDIASSVKVVLFGSLVVGRAKHTAAVGPGICIIW